MKTLETTIPFAGFFESIHSDELYRALSMIFEDDQGNIISPELLDKARMEIDWSDCYSQYAKEYLEAFSDRFGIELKFSELVSPKYYNFQTDRIFAWIEESEVLRIFKTVDKEQLNARIKANFTSRSGFISHYPNNLDSWPKDVLTWDHNQIGTLIETHVLEKEPEFLGNKFAEWELFEYPHEICREIIANNSDKANRYFDLAYYLRERSARVA